MQRQKLKLAGLVTLVAIGTFTLISLLPNRLQAYNYIQDPGTAEEPLLAMPLLISPNFETYTKLPADQDITSLAENATVPVAYVAELPDNFGAAEISYKFPSSEDWWQSDEVMGFPSLSNIRYVSDNHVLVISVSKPNPAVTKQKFIAGDESIALADGSQGWLTSGRPDQFTNAIVVLKNELIITVASDLQPQALVSIIDKLILT